MYGCIVKPSDILRASNVFIGVLHHVTDILLKPRSQNCESDD